MVKLKHLLMEMEEYAWQLMLQSELSDQGHANFDAAKQAFLLKYPNNAHIWDNALEEYYGYGNDSGC